MSKLDDLIKQYCPDGVEYVVFGDILTYEQPSRYIVKSTIYNDDFDIPVLTAGQTFILGFTNEHDGVYKASKECPVIIFDDFTGAFKWVDFNFKVKSSAMKILKCNDVVTLRYAYHAMSKIGFSSNEHKRLWINTYSLFELPFPNIEIRSEIVRILDSFTLLTAELTAELTARRAQYEYYRDKLLTFDDETAIVKRIKDMLDQTCGGPEKVEYRPLSDVVGIRRGKRVTRQDLFENGEYPVFQNSLVPLGYYDEYNVESETPYIICAGAAGDIGYCSGKFWAADDCFFIEHPEKITRRYVYYFLLTKQEYLKSKVRKASVPRLAHEFVDKLEIPIPPFAVQQEIVSVLDKFNNLTTDISTGLPAEISLRQKQYEHYRDRLLNFNGGGYALNNGLCYVKKLTLKEVSNVFRGEYITKKDVEEGSIPVILGGQEPAYYINKSNHEGEIVVIARSGASAGFVSYWNCPIFVTDGFGYEAKDSVAITKYLFYVLKNLERTLNSMKRGAGVPHVSGESLSNVLLPIPPVEDQEIITAILDKFDSLCNNLSEGLPAEIEARRKQYEYYRDRLLDFKERKA